MFDQTPIEQGRFLGSHVCLVFQDPVSIFQSLLIAFGTVLSGLFPFPSRQKAFSLSDFEDQ